MSLTRSLRSAVTDRPAPWTRLSRQTAPIAILAGVVIGLLGWRGLVLVPKGGFDPSWGSGLEMAASRGLVFGRQVIFTYGPLGFLSVRAIWSGGLAVVAFAYTSIVRFLLAYAAFTAARRSFGALPGLVIAFVVVSVGVYFVPELAVLLILGVSAIGRAGSTRQAVGISSAAGTFAAVELLNKVSIGVALVVMSGAIVVGLPGRRRWPALAATLGFIATLLIVWLAIGQPLNALPDYVLGSARISSGYAPAVSIEQPGLGWQYPVALVALAVGVLAAWDTTAGAPPRQRVGVLLLWIAFWFFAFKEGFVRHDDNHAAVFFGVLPIAFLAFSWRSGRRLLAVAAIAVLVGVGLHVQSASLTDAANPETNLRAALGNAHDVLSPSRRAAEMAAGRAEIEATEPLTRRELSLVRGRTVAIYPSEIALAWAYHLRWDPLPLLQSYNAYTTALDEIDARDLASSAAPDRIIFQLPPQPYLDGRVLSFDQPSTSRALLCRYRELGAGGDVAVLARGPNRCSPPALISTVHAAWGQEVMVPAPRNSRSLVSVRIDGVGITGLESIRSFLFKPRQRFIQLNDGPTYRLVPGTAADGLPLRAGPLADLPPPFNVAVDARTIAVQVGTDSRSRDTPITFSFYEQTVR